MEILIDKESLDIYKITNETNNLGIYCNLFIGKEIFPTYVKIFWSMPNSLEIKDKIKSKEIFTVYFIEGNFEIIANPISNDELTITIDHYLDEKKYIYQLKSNQFERCFEKFWKDLKKFLIEKTGQNREVEKFLEKYYASTINNSK